MSYFKKGGRLLLRWMTPIPMLMDSGRSVAKSAGNIGEAVKSAGEAKQKREDRARASDKEWQGLTAEQRFQKAYEVGAWSEEDLAKQSGSIRVAKFVFLFFGFALMPVVAANFILMPWWLAVFLGPLFVFFIVFSFAQALRHAWWDCQISQRSLITFKEFLSRRDMWSYLFT